MFSHVGDLNTSDKVFTAKLYSDKDIDIIKFVRRFKIVSMAF